MARLTNIRGMLLEEALLRLLESTGYRMLARIDMLRVATFCAEGAMSGPSGAADWL